MTYTFIAAIADGGMVAGYLNWTHSVDERVGQAQLAPAILAVCRSIVARTDNGRYKHAIRKIEFPLSNLVGNHGFADGDALISRDDDSCATSSARPRPRSPPRDCRATSAGSTPTTTRSGWSAIYACTAAWSATPNASSRGIMSGFGRST